MTQFEYETWQQETDEVVIEYLFDLASGIYAGQLLTGDKPEGMGAVSFPPPQPARAGRVWRMANAKWVETLYLEGKIVYNRETGEPLLLGACDTAIPAGYEERK